MVTRKPYRAWLLKTAVGVALMVPTVMALSTVRHDKGPAASLQVSSGNSITATEIITHRLIPSLLSQRDVGLYQSIYTSQKAANWIGADSAIAKLDNDMLMGHMLAERYLSVRYQASTQELTEWLQKYSDHPQAAAIYTLATNRSAALKHEIPVVTKQASLEGYGDDNGLAGAKESYMQQWQNGLKAWHKGSKAEAAKLFSSVSDHRNDISPWMRSAAAYWAYRSYNAIGNDAKAEMYLTIAAEEPRSFYGILARKQLKQGLDLDMDPPALTETDMHELVSNPAIRRSIALAEAGITDLADRELRAQFPQADEQEKRRMLSLAHELGLASVQITMATRLARDGKELDFARYPIPNIEPDGGFRVDPLLIFSLMRQESGFRVSAVSSGGAVGLMQLMPKTGAMMHKQNTQLPDRIGEPMVNITLGQEYVEHLLSNNLVGGNLIYLLTAYNAGPGRLQEWKAREGANDDPLYFVETIPYAQTRHYVMQVMTNYWIYSELVGTSNRSIAALLRNEWPSYDQFTGPVALRGLRTRIVG